MEAEGDEGLEFRHPGLGTDVKGFAFALYESNNDLNFVVRELAGVELGCSLGGWGRWHSRELTGGGASTGWGVGGDQPGCCALRWTTMCMLDARAGSKVRLLPPNPDEAIFITAVTGMGARVVNRFWWDGKCSPVAVVQSVHEKEEVGKEKLGTSEQFKFEVKMMWLL